MDAVLPPPWGPAPVDTAAPAVTTPSVQGVITPQLSMEDVPTGVARDSDVESTASGHGEKSTKKKERPKTRRKKQEPRMPKLSIIDVQQHGEVVECSLETGKHSTVSFKFNRDDDQPEDIASNLVCWSPFILINIEAQI